MPRTAEEARIRAAQLREGLAVSGALAREVNAVLDACSGRLADLQVAVAAVAQRTQVREHCPDHGRLQRLP
jgi:hypothetical protein